MIRSLFFPVAAAVSLAAVSGALAASIEQSTITQVVKQVDVLQAATRQQKPAKPSEVFRIPDVMRTGTDSRAEMVAPDETVTRVGANTVFSFSPQSREINLQKGSVLFSSPTGKGGGTIKTAAATASVLGTTIIVVATKNGGFKLLVIEGHAKATLPNGKTRNVGAGQLTFVMPGSTEFGPVITFRLSEQAGNANLVRGFKRPLPSDAKIKDAIARQEQTIKNGQFIATNIQVQGDQLVTVDLRQQTAEILAGDGARLVRALSTDAVIATPTLEEKRLFTFTDIPEEIAAAIGGAALDGLNFFAARNTTVTSPTVDLARFEGAQLFAFVSAGDFLVTGDQSFNLVTTVNTFNSVTLTTTSTTAFASTGSSSQFTGLSRTPLYFVVGGGFAVENTALVADVAQGVSFYTGLLKDAPFTIMAGSLQNPSGNLTVSAPSIEAASVGVITPNGDIDLTARTGSLTVNQAVTRNRNVSNGSNSTNSSSINAFVAGGDQPYQVTGQHSISLGAATDLNLTNALLSARDISLSAQTVNLNDVNFARNSHVTLASQNGRLSPSPNTNRPSIPGNVNFINNVTYGFSPAQNFVGSQISIQKR